MKPRPCRGSGCSQLIIFARSEAGKLMPVEADQDGNPIPAPDDGRLVVFTQPNRRGWYCRSFTDWDGEHGLQDWEIRARDHYQTCPAAGEFSGSR